MKVGPERWRGQSQFSALVSLTTVAIVVCALYFGKDVLVPLALALLCSFLLATPVSWLEKLRLGRPLSVVIVLTVAVVAASAICWLGVTQLAEVLGNLPHYQRNIQKKIEAMRNPASHSLLTTSERLQELSAHLSGQDTTAEGAAAGTSGNARTRRSATPKPIPVELVPHRPGIADSFTYVGVPLLHMLETAAAVLIFTLFMLLQRSDLRNRLLRLFGSGHLNTTTTAMDDAAQRVSRYLLTQSLVNTAFGLALGTGLYFIGVPNAPFWGVLGTVLRFIPYVGTLTAGVCPLVLALAVFDGWTKPLLTFGVFAGVELTISAAVEPLLYGAHTGISSLAILISAAFWTLLWGPVGLVLATPLSVCLLVAGRYVAPLRVLSVVLGDQPVLPPEAVYYQRLLAFDDVEALQVADTYLKEKSLLEFYDLVLIPALALAEQDRHENALDEEREKFIYETTKDLIGKLSEATPAFASHGSKSVLCVPARDEADELVGLMLAHLLRESGVSAEATPIGTVEEMLAAVAEHRADILFVSALPPFALTQSRALCRRVHQKFPDLKTMVGFWDSAADLANVQKRFAINCLEKVSTTLREAVLQVGLGDAIPGQPSK